MSPAVAMALDVLKIAGSVGWIVLWWSTRRAVVQAVKERDAMKEAIELMEVVRRDERAAWLEAIREIARGWKP